VSEGDGSVEPCQWPWVWKQSKEGGGPARALVLLIKIG